MVRRLRNGLYAFTRFAGFHFPQRFSTLNKTIAEMQSWLVFA
jgi:hypothetical protein